MTDAPLLSVEGLACGYRGRTVLEDIGLTVRAGELLCLLGPNGVGKTTLFKTILRLLPAKAGTIRVGGEDTAGWPAARFARSVGYVPQAHTPPFPFSVLDVVSMGRAARLGPFAAPSKADMAVAARALEALSVAHLARRPYTAISGGERQLVLIARALAQEPAVLVMDEPTSNLDFGNQIAVLDHVRALARRSGIGVVLTCHDPNHALRCATRVAALDRDGALVTGPPEDVVTEAYLLRTYGVRTRRLRVPRDDGDGDGGRGDGMMSFCLPLDRGRDAGAGPCAAP